ncbi:MAG: putative addiction module antidote protein, partial [Acidobacteriota bacterium]|nr:putative addiction module antidote protein [Acidobacteriota bacterium]
MKEYIDDLYERPRDPKYAEEYLKAALEEGDEGTFLLALRDVADTRGLSQVASEAQLNREHVYRLLSAKGNPRLTTIQALLRALGFQLGVSALR